MSGISPNRSIAMKKLILAAALFLITAPVAAQESVQARATIRVGEVMTLEVRPGAGTPTTDGTYRELKDAVDLRILANRRWQLHVMLEGPQGRVASGEAVGVAEPSLWWRVARDQANASYVRAERSPILIASGAGGRTEIDVDYRWLDGPGREIEPGATLHFMLSSH
jgi:hypothetical protein